MRTMILRAALGAIVAGRLKNGLKKPSAWRLHLLLALRHPLDLLGHQDLQLLMEVRHCWIEATLFLGLPEGIKQLFNKYKSTTPLFCVLFYVLSIIQPFRLYMHLSLYSFQSIFQREIIIEIQFCIKITAFLCFETKICDTYEPLDLM